MELISLNVKDYIAQLGSDAPAPGGGSASALCGAQGAALAAMVAQLTLGRPKYAEFEPHCREAAQRAGELQRKLLEAIDRDTAAFNLVSAAFKLPKETEEDKAARRQAIADATLKATEVPFETMRLACDALDVCRSLVGKSNQSAASDLGVSALNLLCCVRGAWLNVLINLGGVKDEAARARFQSEGERMEAHAAQLAGEIFDCIRNSL